MWAREIRKAFLQKHPETNISMTARRLSEMWATVPIAEREQWKRKAKRECMVKARATKSGAPLMPSRKFINKKGGPIAPLMNSTPTVTPKTPVQEQSPVSFFLLVYNYEKLNYFFRTKFEKSIPHFRHLVIV